MFILKKKIQKKSSKDINLNVKDNLAKCCVID